MRILKTIFCSLFAVIAVGLLAFSCYFLLLSIPRQKEAPEVLQSELIFQEEPEAEPVPEPVIPPPAVPVITPELPAEEAPEEEPPAVPEEPTFTPQQLAEAYLVTMTTEQKLWQLFITTPEAITHVNLATRAGEATKTALQTYPVGGICYFADNLKEAEQTQIMLTNTQAYASTGLFLCIDEEGGTVSRAGFNPNMEVTPLKSAAEYGAAGDAAILYADAVKLAQELTALGFNLNFAPVADIALETENNEIGTRAYSSDPKVAADMVTAMVTGLDEGGMLSCLKHFPGHGSAQTDSHEDSSISERTLEEMQSTDWVPFRAGVEQGVPFVMLSHLTNENISEAPASLSPEVVEFLRQELGFTGVVITDSQKMGAIANHYSSGDAAVLAIQAGADMILMPADLQAAFDGLKAAMDEGKLTEERINESVLRILTVKYEQGILK